jgi:type III secretion protein J
MQSFNRYIYWLCFLFLCVSCGSERTIVNGLDEKEANEILVFLSSRGIQATKIRIVESGGGGAKAAMFDLTVPEDQANEAMSLLNKNGLPRRRGQNLLGLFSNVGLVPSEMQDKIRYQAGLAEQIASTIRKIDGVLDAEVQISFPEEDPLNPKAEKKQKITASVYVKHSGVLDDPNAHLITKIKRLVSSSIVGLDFDNVTVIGDRARFSELPGGAFVSGHDEDKSYVNVWSLIIAQESLLRFRVIFFSFTILALLLLLSLIWVCWKVMPLLKDRGGIKELFHFHPISTEPLFDPDEIEEQTEVDDKKGGKSGSKQLSEGVEPAGQGLIDEDIDES